MNRIFLLLFAVVVAFSISACGALFKNEDAKFRNHGKDYLEARPLKTIEVPEGMDEPEYTPLFPVPETSTRDEFGDVLQLKEYEVPRPESPFSSDTAFGVKIQKLGSQQWVSLGVSSNQVWPRVQNYLAVSNIPVIYSHAPSGVIETDWLKFTNDEEHAVRFRILIAKGVHEETTEINILEQQIPQADELPKDSAWPGVSDDTDREAWFLRQIAEHLASSIDNASASLLGQNVGGEVKVTFLKNAPEATMKMRLSQERAWVMIRQAASSEGFVQWDANESQGIIFAGYDPKLAKEKGFWGKVFSLGRNGPVPKTSRYPLDEVLSHLSEEADTKALFESNPVCRFGSALPDLQAGFLIVVTREESASHVVIRDERGRQLHSEQAKALLRVLRNNLI